jgi:hypothetical protein
MIIKNRPLSIQKKHKLMENPCFKNTKSKLEKVKGIKERSWET